jgi:DNA-binding MarR family transcriptional regulator
VTDREAGPAGPVAADLPLSALLSQVLIAFTIEFDNEFEHELPHTTTWGPAAHSGRGPWLVSMAMWANFMRFLDADGRPLHELQDQVRLTNLPGLERWRYVDVEPDPADERPKPPRRDWIVRPTRAGRRAQQLWRPLAATIETRWQERFGSAEIDRLRSVLLTLTEEFDVELPSYLPVAGVAKQDHTLWPPVGSAGPAAVGPAGAVSVGGAEQVPELAALLARVLLALTIDFERESRLSLALSANALRVLTEPGVRVRDLPGLTGVSKEAISASVKFLEQRDCVVVEPDPAASRTKLARLTPKGQRAQGKYRRVLGVVEESWRAQYGEQQISSLRESLAGLLDQRDGDQSRLGRGLEPYPDGWRAHPPYLALTRAMIRNPQAALPQYPVVSHRGGFPDGS